MTNPKIQQVRINADFWKLVNCIKVSTVQDYQVIREAYGFPIEIYCKGKIGIFADGVFFYR